MLQLKNPADEVLEGALDSPGGFAWWYADLLDADGNGLVLIPSWGLPFLPGYTSAARAGEAPPARQRPSIALSVYERGVCVYYLLHTFSPDDAIADGHRLRFGESTFRFANGSMDATLSLPAPGGRLTGSIHVRGTPRGAATTTHLDHAEHEWCPLTGPAHGTWSLRGGSETFQGAGSAYLDRNAGRSHLEDLGVMRWTWARAVLADRTRIAYALWDRDDTCHATLVDIHDDGRCETRPATLTGGSEHRNLWGLRWWSALSIAAGDRTMTLDVKHRPDDGPFYQRTLCTVQTELGEAPGVAEVCDSRRIDLAWHRPLVRMCVSRDDRPSSIWLPLFAGPRERRLGRLLGVA